MDRDMLFAFAHGIRLTLESLGLPFDGDVMHPVLQRIAAITSNSKHSLIKGDDSVTDWDQFHHFRAVEHQLCVEYLKGVNANMQPATDEGETDGTTTG